MNSGKLEEIFQKILNNEYEIDFERKVDISQFVIPFSIIFKNYKTPDVYSGTEKIPFNERDPEYKMILRQEFADFLR